MHLQNNKKNKIKQKISEALVTFKAMQDSARIIYLFMFDSS